MIAASYAFYAFAAGWCALLTRMCRATDPPKLAVGLLLDQEETAGAPAS